MSRKKTILSYKRKIRTDYRKRLSLLKSNKLRLVVRKALNNVLLQIVKYEANGDKILVTAHSTILKKYGWNYHKGNLPSAYLTGIICGKLAKKKDIHEVILDIGLARSIKGSVQYAAVKGVIDSGLKINCSEDVFPKEDKLSGKTISDDVHKKFLEIKGKILGEK